MQPALKKALIITYYWPPAGGGGVQRWLKFSKYMRSNGWEPVIFTPDKPEIVAHDESLAKQIPEGIEVMRTPIWEPFHIYKFLIGKKQHEKVYSGVLVENKKKSFMQTFSLWVRGNLFIPDAKKFWIAPSITYLKKYLATHNIDAIVSTGPPHSTHMIALGIKKHMPQLPWIADFRDPWTNVDYWSQLNLSAWAERKHHRLQAEVLRNADKVVTVSWSWAQDFVNLNVRKDIEVVTNGYDHADFESGDVVLDGKFTITHVGSMNADRNPHVLWKALQNILKQNSELEKHIQIQLLGPLDNSVNESISSHGLDKFVTKVHFMPHREVIQRLCQSQVLLLPINNTPNVGGVLPGKLYEYLGAKRPIICITTTGTDSERLMRESGAADICGYDDVPRMEQIVLSLFEKYKNKQLNSEPKGVEKFARQNLCKQFFNLFDSITIKAK
ncbi:MAG: glycosyltransferase family 4 protein [Bacteroidetes bacterium]|nr:glycosyltransferase family 4 protein [Bacteroidota bacterium]